MTPLENTAKQGLVVLLLLMSFFIGTLKAQDYEVEKISINALDEDFGAVRFKNGIVFCSDRTHKKFNFDEDSARYYTDMFYSELLPNNKWTDARLFSNELADYLNEGPATFNSPGNTIYYTANYAPKDSASKNKIEEYKLGIFISSFNKGIWTKGKPFPFNSSKSDFNVAHPALSPNDSILYFASNMPGGIGGTDLYKCIWKNGRWSLPINLGANVNTADDEIFPFVSQEGILYFTSNREYDGHKGDLNIFSVRILDDGYATPKPMPEPINSTDDDFAYAEYEQSQYGFFSSNRLGKNDDIFQFRMNVPNFNDCKENFRPIFCYNIEDLIISPVDTLPVVYEWTLGDGSTQRGLSIQHCYDTLGTYHVALNIIDTLTNTVFYKVSETTIDIREAEQPYILSNDTTVKDVPTKFYSDDRFIKNFQVEKKYWIIDNRESFEGDSLVYAFTEPGTHTVLCGVTGPTRADGTKEKSCAYKHVVVLEDAQAPYPKADPNPNVEPVQKIAFHENFNILALQKDPQLAPLYHIIIAESKTRLTFNDPLFSKTRFVIIEAQNDSGDYVYTVGNTAELNRLYPMFKELQDSGYKAMQIEEFTRAELTEDFIRTGKYIERGDAEQLNKEFAKLKDIKFEYNSDEIKEESQANLDYIASMLRLEEDFELKIGAHTCSMGSHEYNLDLSNRRAKSVMKYFQERGVDLSRMSSEGYAETQPVATNTTEEGKALNRRVEFIIVFNEHRIASND
jgi:outer membrane protein OmpA-like peptidoglycan-associated protein